MAMAVVVLRSDDAIIVTAAGAFVTPDLRSIDALARLALAARRSGRRLYVRHASRALEALLALTGLAAVVCPEA